MMMRMLWVMGMYVRFVVHPSLSISRSILHDALWEGKVVCNCV